MANNQAKKVLIFSTAYLPLIGGAEVAVKEITDCIKGFDFDLITAKIMPSLSRFERIGSKRPLERRILRKLPESTRPTAVH